MVLERYVGSVLVALLLVSLAAPLMRAQQLAKPRKVTDVPPVYPEVARVNQIEGVVIVQVTVGTDGRVSNAQVLRSVPMLDEAALAAVRQWVYDPGGLTAPVQMVVTVPFSLKSVAQPVVPAPARPASVPAPPSLSSRPVVIIDSELKRRLQSLAQGTTRRNWGILHERLFISSNRSLLVSLIVRNDSNQENVPSSDTVRIVCGDATTDLECSGVRVFVGRMEVSPSSLRVMPYTSPRGIPNRSRIIAEFHSNDLRNGFAVRFTPPQGVESTYEISKTAAEDNLLLGL